MAIIKASIKSIRQTKRLTSINRIRKNKYKSALKRMAKIIDSGKKKEALNFLPKFTSELMKIAKTNTINQKTASRKISRITKKIKSLK